ncbi:hypothetical protein NHQ30_004858 [Ciborinia camelliae]|nr:hypothetical protein NHQ30_004858 [Ciborinia camelliae]
MATPGSKVTGFTPGQIICNTSEEADKFPGRGDKQQASKQTIGNMGREGHGLLGQIDETNPSDDQKTPAINDVPPLFGSARVGDIEKRVKERRTRRELQERDQNAIEYTKSLLDEGDTLVYVSYPGGIRFYDSKGVTQPYKIYRVDSEKLKALGSPKFSRMFEERPQYWARKRKSLLHYLPDGVKYVLDLTPSEEGDEAVELVSELSCSEGIRNWYLAEKRCGVEKRLVSGDDNVPGPATVSVKAAEQFRLRVPAGGFDDLLLSPLDTTLESTSNDEFIRTSLGRIVPKQGEDIFGDGGSLEDREMQKAIRNSLEDHLFDRIPEKNAVGNAPQDSPQAMSKKEVLDYCPIRHRFGVENLLRVIQGKVPVLDSAPKVWTLFVLAKYYECTSVVVDYITSWIMTGNNIKFLEILPEASLNIGLGLKIPMITRAAFSILVSEEALNVASRTLCNSYMDREVYQHSFIDRGTYQYVRPREELDEDLWNVIQHASQDFCDRIQKTITDLLDERMAWFLELPEYRKICKFEDYCYKKKDKSKKEEDIYERRKSTIQKLLINLRGYVRGRIVTCLNRGLSVSQAIAANSNQREVQWEIQEAGMKEVPDSNYVYNGLGDRERVLLPYFWRCLLDVDWNWDPIEDYTLARYTPQLIRSGKGLVDRAGICSTNIRHLETYIWDFNHEVCLAVNRENFHSSLPYNPAYTIPSPKDNITNGERPNYAFMSAYNQDHAYHQARLAGIKALELELAEFDKTADDSASMSSVTTDASTKPLLDIPLRPKQTNIAVEPGKDDLGIDIKPEPSTRAGNNGKSSTMKLLDNLLENLGHKSSASDQEKDNPITKTSDLGLQTDSPPLPKGIPFGDTSKPFSLNQTPFPNHPDEEHTFNLATFFKELNLYIYNICVSMLSKPDGSEFIMLTDTLLCLTDNEWQYLPLWAGGNDDGSGGVTSADVPPAYYSNVSGLTPGVQYKGAAGFVGVGSSVNTSLDVRDGSTRTVTLAGSEVGSDVGSGANVASDSDAGSVFSTDSYDMAIITPTGSGSESEFEIISDREDEESGDEFTVAGDSVSEREMLDIGKGKENEEPEDENDMDWTDQEYQEDDWEGSFTDD